MVLCRSGDESGKCPFGGECRRRGVEESLEYMPLRGVFCGYVTVLPEYYDLRGNNS